jgi:hypothetical protein
MSRTPANERLMSNIINIINIAGWVSIFVFTFTVAAIVIFGTTPFTEKSAIVAKVLIMFIDLMSCITWGLIMGALILTRWVTYTVSFIRANKVTGDEIYVKFLLIPVYYIMGMSFLIISITFLIEEWNDKQFVFYHLRSFYISLYVTNIISIILLLIIWLGSNLNCYYVYDRQPSNQINGSQQRPQSTSSV